jgi:hypothetical protein
MLSIERNADRIVPDLEIGCGFLKVGNESANLRYHRELPNE